MRKQSIGKKTVCAVIIAVALLMNTSQTIYADTTNVGPVIKFVIPEEQNRIAIAEKIMPRIVMIIRADGGYGAGILIQPGVLLTASHVVADDAKVMIRFEDSENQMGTVLACDTIRDLALVRIKGVPGLPTEHIQIIPRVNRGQTVYIFGNPNDQEFSMSAGIVSHPCRLINFMGHFQTDAAINPGSSGGPAINSKGELIGIVERQYTEFSKLGYVIRGEEIQIFLNTQKDLLLQIEKEEEK